MESLEKRGFINYVRKPVWVVDDHAHLLDPAQVGMQRFGKGGVRSDLLGLAYLQAGWMSSGEGSLFSRKHIRKPSAASSLLALTFLVQRIAATGKCKI